MREEGINNGEIGKLGLYGGKPNKKKDKTFQDTVSRELEEESGQKHPPSDFNYETFIHVMSDRDNKPILTKAEIFSLNLSWVMELEQVEAKYRDSRIMTSREISRARALGQLSAVASEALSKARGI
jgi:ADP-ribose pyrophosphatase YjhB (NUDIX family)